MRAILRPLRVINWGCVLPILGYLAVAVAVAVAVAIIAGALYLDRHRIQPPQPNVKTAIGQDDELARELARCEGLGSRAQDDQACVAAWAANRNRFFGSQSGKAPQP
jgi:conjugative transfer region protein TrbK